MRRAYLDHAATSPLRPEALAALQAALALPGNPSSVHAEGRAARACLEAARRTVARHFGVGRDGVVFTSGGTEANALALHQATAKGAVALVAATAHASALAAPDVEPLPVDARGQSDLAWLERRLAAAPPVAVVSTVAVNNETGILDASLPDLARLARAHGALVHLDRTQDLRAAAWIPDHADLATLSAHKVGGPKGIGALLLKEGLDLHPFLKGGGQEARRRGGTEAFPLAAAFAAALEAGRDDAERLEDLGRALARRLEAARGPGATVAGLVGAPRSHRINALVLQGVSAMTQLMALDLEGFAVSAGSACSSGKVESSHVLQAMGFPPEISACTIRVSLGWSTAAAEIERFEEAYLAMAGRLSGAGVSMP